MLIGDMVQRSWSVWTDRGTDFLTSGLSITDSSTAGVWPAIKGTIVLMVLVVLLAFPLGIACAVYLEEYAGNSRFARWTRVNVRNLAGVPSVVYGLLGLGIFVKVLNGLGEPGCRPAETAGSSCSGGSATSSTGCPATTAATSSPAGLS